MVLTASAILLALLVGQAPALAQQSEAPLAELGPPEFVGQVANLPGERQVGNLPHEFAPKTEQLPQPRTEPAELPAWSLPTVRAGEELLPINLPAALKLANVRAWDIAIAQQQLRLAVAQHQESKVLWIPSLIGGVVGLEHQGPIQANDGSISNTTRSSVSSGIAPLALFNITDAVFTPLARRQDARSQQAGVQTSTNDTLTAVAVAYFDAQEAQADLAAFDTVLRLMDALVRKTETLAPAFIPDVEVARMKALQANFEQAREVARMQWRLASAELARVLRLTPEVVVQPLEPPNLKLTLIPPACPAKDLISVALRTRPELTAYQAQIAAAQNRLRQERFRPFLPNIVVRGNSTPTPYPLGVVDFAAGPGGSLANNGMRMDWDLEAIWELKNLGFGNLALIRQREASVGLARDQEFRFRDYVAKEVVQAWVVLDAADQRSGQSERELQQAWVSATKNLKALGETKRPAGNIVILVIRPQEASSAMQALVQAFYNYYGSVADYNRAQFRLYRALGNPAQELFDHDGRRCPAPASANRHVQ